MFDWLADFVLQTDRSNSHVKIGLHLGGGSRYKWGLGCVYTCDKQCVDWCGWYRSPTIRSQIAARRPSRFFIFFHQYNFQVESIENRAMWVYHIGNLLKYTMHAAIMQNVTGIRPNHMLNARMASTTCSLFPARIAPAFPLNKFSTTRSIERRLLRTNALDPASLVDTATTTTQAVYELAGLNSATAGTFNLILRPVLSIASLLMIVRIVMTWYPEVDGESMPWLIAVKPTGKFFHRYYF